jgi:hypothetical protein
MPLEDVMENDDSGFDQPPPPDWRQNNVEYQAFVRFALLTEQQRDLKNRMEELNAQLETLSYQLRDYLGSKGYRSIEVEGYKIYLQRDSYVRAAPGMNQAIVCDILKRNGMGHFVREQYSTQSLTGHVHGLEDRHAEELKDGRLGSVYELLPAELVAALDLDTRYNIVAKKKGARRASVTVPQPDRIDPPPARRYVSRGPVRPRL